MGLNLSRFALSMSAVAPFFAGCGGSQPAIGAPNAMPRTNGIAADFDRGASWMLPEAKRAKGLLYVGDEATNAVYIYDYASLKSVGELTGVDDPGPMCVDAKGDIYITSFARGTTVEYAHGGTTLLNSYDSGGDPEGCSVDAQGDLAVSSFSPPEFIVYPKGDSSNGETYKAPTPCSVMWVGGYDNAGNLYAGGNGTKDCEAYELPVGGQSIRTVTIKPSLGPTILSFMWDGQHLTVAKHGKHEAMFQVDELASGNLDIVGETHLWDRCHRREVNVLPFVVGRKNTPVNRVEGKVVVGANFCAHSGNTNVDFWRYPAGDNPYAKLPNEPSKPSGAVVSIGS
jgi:hypothetical protein